MHRDVVVQFIIQLERLIKMYIYTQTGVKYQVIISLNVSKIDFSMTQIK